MKKIFYGMFSLFFSSASLNAETWDNCRFFQWPTCVIPQNEWRIGVGVGVEYFNLEAKVKSHFSPLGVAQFGDRNQNQKHLQMTPSLEIGKTFFNDYYIGIVSSWHYSGAHKKSREPLRQAFYFKHELKMSYYADILAKVGCKLTPKTMIFGLVGPSLAKWSHKTEQFYYNFVQNQETKSAEFKVAQTTLGLGLGGGVEQVICKNLILSLNYTHHFYKGKGKRKNMEYIEVVPRFNPQLNRFQMAPVTKAGQMYKRVIPSSDAVTVRLSYFF